MVSLYGTTDSFRVSGWHIRSKNVQYEVSGGGAVTWLGEPDYGFHDDLWSVGQNSKGSVCV